MDTVAGTRGEGGPYGGPGRGPCAPRPHKRERGYPTFIAALAAIAFVGVVVSNSVIGVQRREEHSVEKAALQQRIDSLAAQLDTANHELRFFRKYVTPDSTWVAEQVSLHLRDPDLQGELTRYFVVYGMQVGISPRVLAAVGRTESAFRRRAVSSADAHGVMQVVPDVWWNRFRDECGEWNPYDERRSICYGAHILRYEYDRWGTLTDALSAYNSGLPAHRSTAGARYARKVGRFLTDG